MRKKNKLNFAKNVELKCNTQVIPGRLKSIVNTQYALCVPCNNKIKMKFFVKNATLIKKLKVKL